MVFHERLRFCSGLYDDVLFFQQQERENCDVRCIYPKRFFEFFGGGGGGTDPAVINLMNPPG
jgi:hypothetical protein